MVYITSNAYTLSMISKSFNQIIKERIIETGYFALLEAINVCQIIATGNDEKKYRTYPIQVTQGPHRSIWRKSMGFVPFCALGNWREGLFNSLDLRPTDQQHGRCMVFVEECREQTAFTSTEGQVRVYNARKQKKTSLLTKSTQVEKAISNMTLLPDQGANPIPIETKNTAEIREKITLPTEDIKNILTHRVYGNWKTPWLSETKEFRRSLNTIMLIMRTLSQIYFIDLIVRRTVKEDGTYDGSHLSYGGETIAYIFLEKKKERINNEESSSYHVKWSKIEYPTHM